jgi:hypothetical protein
MDRTNAEWLDGIEDVIDALRRKRADLRSQIYDADLESGSLWSDTERRWRRLEAKLGKAEADAGAAVSRARCQNVDRLIEVIDDAYFELDRLLE